MPLPQMTQWGPSGKMWTPTAPELPVLTIRAGRHLDEMSCLDRTVNP